VRIDRIERTAYAERSSVEHVDVDHRRIQAAVAQQLLDRPHIDAALQQVSGEAVTQGVKAALFG